MTATNTDSKKTNSKIRVLMVDDSPINRSVYAQFIERMDHLVDTAQNGEEALQKLSESAFDLVFMDVEMPKMNGIVATKTIRSAKSPVKNRNVPIVAMTAHTSQEDRDACTEAGMNTHIQKPVSFESLRKTLERFFPHMTTASQVTTAPPDRPNANAASFDKKALLIGLGGDESIFNQLLTLFVDHSVDTFDSLKTAVTEGDAAEIRSAAHAFRNACANVRAGTLCSVIHKIEECGKNDDVEKARIHLPTVENQYKNLLEEIRRAL